MVLSKQFNIYSLQELKLLALLQCTGESLAFTITEGSMKEAVERMGIRLLKFYPSCCMLLTNIKLSLIVIVILLLVLGAVLHIFLGLAVI